MPSPSVSSTKTQFSPTFTVGGISTSISITSDFCINLSTGFVSGWSVSAPTTPSSFETEIISAFGSYVSGGSNGLLWLTCVGKALDDEVDAWIASWDSSTHTYTPSSGSIISNIEGCEPLTSEATVKMNQLVADWFISNFSQEGA